MKRILSKTFIFLGVISLVLGTLNSFGQSFTYAEDLELIGADLGLEIIPNDTRLFDLNRLNPGDTEEATITIKNSYKYAFQLFMRTERMTPVPSEGDPDLFDQLILTVYLGDEEIYSGPMKDYATTNISLGRFFPKALKNLRAVVHLPGPETGNEFQGATLEVKWIFIAQADEPIDPDPDPEEPEEPEKPEEPEEPEKPEEPKEPKVQEDFKEPEDPEEPDEDEVVIDEEVPTDVPDIDEEEVDEETPKDVPRMPKTGELSPIIFYGFGITLIIAGVGLKFNKKK